MKCKGEGSRVLVRRRTSLENTHSPRREPPRGRKPPPCWQSSRFRPRASWPRTCSCSRPLRLHAGRIETQFFGVREREKERGRERERDAHTHRERERARERERERERDANLLGDVVFHVHAATSVQPRNQRSNSQLRAQLGHTSSVSSNRSGITVWHNARAVKKSLSFRACSWPPSPSP